MKHQRSGSIVNMSSTAGLLGYGRRTPYAAAKWAVIGLTKSLAIELGRYGVRVNAICPGSVRGDRMDRVIAAEAAARGVEPSVVEAEYTVSQSIGRFVDPQEIADMAVFLGIAGVEDGQRPGHCRRRPHRDIPSLGFGAPYGCLELSARPDGGALLSEGTRALERVIGRDHRAVRREVAVAQQAEGLVDPHACRWRG